MRAAQIPSFSIAQQPSITMPISHVTRVILSLVVLVQAYQMYKLHTVELGSSALSKNTFLDRSASVSLTSNSKKTDSNSNPSKDESFSACLMIMDDNAHLIEWLAYHYTTLPLRRLIVAVDPRSQTSPIEILRRWDGMMDVTVWSDVDFMPPTLMDKHQYTPNKNQSEITKLFRQRQEEFYTRCMARLKYEGRSWTAFIDTDEYMLINANAHDKYKMPTSGLSSSTTILESIHRVERESDFLASEYFQSPCLAMARLAFGVKESTSDEVQRDVPYPFDGHDFQTLQWRWHAGRGMKKVNKISKSILDVSRVDSSLFVPTDQVMVHLPSKTHCRGEEHLWVLNSYSPIIVHHYAGTWEQWSHRKDTRGRRTKEKYALLQYDKTTDDHIRPWLQQFVNQVGIWQARNLLRDVGKIPSVE